MYTPLYPIHPNNLYYIPQYGLPDVQFQTYFSQLPTTYQNQFIQPTHQFMPIPTQWIQPKPISTNSDSQHKVQDSEQTLQKSQQKRIFKKFSIFKYPKKNAESNIINQVFSFLSLRVKSEPMIQKIFENNQQKIENFYEVLKQLKKGNKKYINRCYIKDLTLLEKDHIGHRIIKEIIKKGSRHAIRVEQFKRGIRILVNYYLRSKCIFTVITSRKLDKQTMKEHLYRKREVLQYFSNQMSIARDAKQ